MFRVPKERDVPQRGFLQFLTFTISFPQKTSGWATAARKREFGIVGESSGRATAARDAKGVGGSVCEAAKGSRRTRNRKGWDEASGKIAFPLDA